MALRVEVRWSDPPIGPVVSAAGGRVLRLAFDAEVAVVTVELPPSADITALAEQIESAYTEIDVSLQQRVPVEATAGGDRGDSPLERLTDRQLSALETAYFGGYFEWPRNKSADELADAMGVAGATFHQHLRAAEREIVSHLLDS